MIKISVKRPMLLSAVAIAICAAIAGFFGFIYLLIFLPIIVIGVFCFVKNKRHTFAVLLALFILSFSFLNVTHEINKTRDFCFSNYDLNLIAIKNPVLKDSYGQVEVLSVNNGKLPEKQKFILYFYGSLSVKAGDVFSASVKIEPLENSDSKLYYYSNNVFYKLKLVSFNEITDSNDFYATMQKVRHSVENKLFINMSKDTASTMCAITYGDKSYLSDDFSVKIRRAGVSHVMVVSGMHLAIIMSGIFTLLDRLFYNRYLRCLLSVICVFLICGICGFTMSITRAGLMYVLAAFAPLLFRENDSVNTLGTTVSLIVLISPYAIFNISFLLSVTATYGVVGLSPFYSELLSKRIHKDNFVLRGAISLVCGTLCAMIMTLPITIYCFEEVSLIAPLTNIAITYPVTWALTIVLYALLLSFIPYISFLATPIFKVVEFFVKYINIIINDFGSYKYSAISVGKNFVFIAIAVVALVITFMYYYQYKLKIKKYKEDKDACTV